MIKYALSLLVLLAALAPRIGWAGLIGEPAPPLVVKAWIKGNPVEIRAGTNVFVVEIWNSSFPACRASVTNLNDLQKRFRTNGVVVVGLSDEPVEKLKEFVQHEGTNIMYAVAADDMKKTSLSYMLPVKQQGLPHAFVVGTNGNLLWHGHPQGGLNETVEQIIAGRFDVEQAQKSAIADRQMAQYLGLARRGDARARLAGRMLLANRTNDVVKLCDVAFQIATAPQLAQRDFALAGAALDQAEKLAPTNTAQVMIVRAVLLFESGKRDEGLARATQALAAAQSQKDKAEVQACLSTMKARLAKIKSPPGNTNQGNLTTTPDPVPVINTNRSKDSADKP